MRAFKIITETIEEGLDRKHLTTLKQRFMQLNEQRLARTLSALPERAQTFLDLLPLLFHCNHPMLPGYVSHQTPCGISGYSPGKKELRQAQTLARSFKFQQDLHQHRYLYALFVMGSVGTVAHSQSSDLDIWVCYKPGLSANSLKQLKLKCQQLTREAAKIGVEAHFFLMDCEAFKAGQVSTLDSESSGSAQHYLLLDEFYRTALLLAGRLPLWWLVPSGREHSYADYASTLLQKRFLRTADVIDFGGVARIPPGEFIGAGIWQLYKAIESPYKSVLKLLLLESYASEYPQQTTLAQQFKQHIYNGHLDVNELDPYVMVYRHLEDYLTKRREYKRLELLRRCFYFKIGKPLTKAHRGNSKSWQRQLLEKLVQEWGWSRDQLLLLDARPHWKAKQVVSERKALVNELTISYRFLKEFARQSQAHVAINADELKVLGRKLYAAFERRAGKIDWINPGISPDLSEPWLSLVHSAGGPEAPVGAWTAYAQPPQEQPLRSRQAIKKSRHLVELLLWCHCNGILTTATRAGVISVEASRDSSLEINTCATQLRQTVQAIYQWLPLPLPEVRHENFQRAAHCQRLLLLVNIGSDPHQHLQQQGIHRLSNQVDSLGYSALKENLVATIDTVAINSWNEVSCRRFTDDALLQCLVHYLNLTPPADGKHLHGTPLPQLSIHCYTPSRGNAIRQRIELLFQDIAACYYSGVRPPTSRFLFAMAGQFYALQFLDQRPRIKRLANQAALLRYLEQPQAEYSPIVVDRYALQGHPLRAIAQAEVNTAVQVYFASREQQADVYVIDEKGSLFNSRMPFHDLQTLLRPLHRFIRAVMERLSLEGAPLQADFGVHPVEFFEWVHSRREQQLERRTVTTDLNRLAFFDIQVIAEPGPDEELRFSIYCDQQEFSELEYGPRLFAVVVEAILSRRASAERYPCYITDLDLSQCKATLAPHGDLQLCHYLQVKSRLEARLNAALLNIQADTIKPPTPV